MVVWAIFIAYLLAGVVALVVLDISTGRIRNRIAAASQETQEKLTTSGNIVGIRTARVVILFALWLLWPIAIFGALFGKGGDSET